MTIQNISSEEEIRYNRQLILPEIGIHGQIKLKQTRVLIAGVGGIGSVSAYYLAAAGIGSIRIADGDCVETGNLNRQILHGTGISENSRRCPPWKNSGISILIALWSRFRKSFRMKTSWIWWKAARSFWMEQTI